MEEPKQDAKQSADGIPWDFSIYPEMTEAQRKVVFEIGLTLHGVQVTEQGFAFMLKWVFPKDSAMDLKTLYAMDKGTQKHTLGQLLVELRKRLDVHAEFDAMLAEFLDLRNRFVHRLFNEKECSLATDEGCIFASKIMERLQFLNWDIQRLTMGYNLLWAEHNSHPQIRDFFGKEVEASPHLQQVRSHFQYVLHPKTNSKKTTT